MNLTDEQWRLVERSFPPPPPPRRGRPPVDYRRVLDGILWKFCTDSPWYDLPPEYPSHQSCYRYHHTWKRSGLMAEIIFILYTDLRERGGLDLRHASDTGSIKLLPVGGGWKVEIPLELLGTWQASAIWMICSLGVRDKRTSGE